MFRLRIRVGSCGRLSLDRSHLGSQPQVRWLAVTRRLRHACDSDPNFENYCSFGQNKSLISPVPKKMSRSLNQPFKLPTPPLIGT